MSAVLAIAGVILVLDQLTKAIVLERLSPGVMVPVIDGFFALTLVLNPGLAFGLLGGLPRPWRWVVAVLSLLALFTHQHLFWIAALLIALVQFPDFSTPMNSAAASLEKLARWVRPEPREAKPGADLTVKSAEPVQPM